MIDGNSDNIVTYFINVKFELMIKLKQSDTDTINSKHSFTFAKLSSVMWK